MNEVKDPTNKPLKVFMMPTLNAPIVWYRMECFINEMRRQKLPVEIAYRYHGPGFIDTCNWEKEEYTKEFIATMDMLAREADVIVFQSVHTQRAVALICALQHKYQKPVLMEIDDDIYGVQSSSLAFKYLHPDSLPELWSDDQLRQSDGVICSTEYLRTLYTQKNPRIDVVPNCIDFSIWDNLNEPKRKRKRLRIGWAGGATHDSDLNMIKGAILEIVDKYENVEVVIVTGGTVPEYLKHNRIKIYDWHYWKPIDKYPQFLKNMQFDIGLSPLRDTNFNRSKSNLKWLEYSALKIPAVLSKVEPYASSVEHGRTGFLCREPEEFVEWLSLLIEREDVRKMVGQRAYEVVKTDFNLSRIAQRYYEILKRYHETGRVHEPRGIENGVHATVS
jgi:glycosyltransferase involved in cell wall biosynthesis